MPKITRLLMAPLKPSLAMAKPTPLSLPSTKGLMPNDGSGS